jgi:hypothetical protein
MNAHRCVVVVGLVGLVACTDTSVPTGTFIACNDEGGCPAGLVCDEASDLCVREQPDPLTPVATVSRALVGQPDIDSALGVDVDITFVSAPPELPRVVVERRGTVVGSVDTSGSTTAYTAALTPTAQWHDGSDGVVDVVVEAVNGVGVLERAYVAQIVVDITAPVVGAVAVNRVVDPQRTPFAFEIADDVAISPTATVEVSVVPTEPLRLEGDDAPTLTLVDVDGIALVRDEGSESPLVFAMAWPEPVPAIDAAVSVRARLVDLAGNVAEVDVLVDDDALHIDTIPPDVAAVDAAGAVVFERAPWGRSERAGFDVFTVQGTAAVEPTAHVLIARDADGRREVGRTQADDAGDFGGIARDFLLDTADVVDVYVVVGDAAGNVSAPVRVRDQVFFAAMNGEEAGDDVLNPHAFESLAIATEVLHQGDVVALDGEDVAAIDDDDAVVTGAGSFELLTTAFGNDTLTSQNGALVRSAIGFDPARGVTLIVGGSATRRIEFLTNSDSTDRDVCSDEAVDDVFVRGRDGRLLRRTSGVLPPAMAGAAVAYSPVLDGLVILGASSTGPQTWLFRDDVFSPLCRESSCALDVGSPVDHGLAWDARSARLIAHGGSLGARTFAFDGSTWTQVCGVGVAGCEAPGGTGSLVVDNDDRLLWWTGSSVHAWSAGSWQHLCTDSACAASAPPVLENSAAAWDRRRGRLVVLGGTLEQEPGFDNCTVNTQRNAGASVSVPPSADTWEFDGMTWTKAAPPTSPPPRAKHRMAYDELRGRVLAVGGDDCDCYAKAAGDGLRPGFSDDLWAFDGTTWERVDQPAAPAGFTAETTFAARDHRLTAWPNEGGTLIYGDNGGTSLHLVKDGRFYRAGNAGGVLGSYVPGLATDDEGTVFGWGGGIVVSGGVDLESTSSVHRLVDVAFVTACVDLPKGAGCQFGGPPQGVFGHAFTFDGVRLVGFGGSFQRVSGGLGFNFSGSAASQVTLVFDPVQGVSDPVTGTRPPSRLAGLLVRDTVAGTSLLYGGAPVDPSVWRFNGTSWTELSTTTTPAARWGHVFAHEGQRGAAVMTLGTSDDAVDDGRSGVLGFEIPASFEDVYEFVDDDWHLARIADPEGDGRPRRRYAVASGTDVDGTVLIHGGTLSPARVVGLPRSSTPRTNELWRFNGGAQARPAQQLRVRVRASRFDDVDGATVRWVFADAPPAGATLSVWRVDHYEALSTSSCGDRCLSAELDATTVRVARFGRSDEVIVQLRGPANGAAPAYAAINTDFVDVALRRRRP